MIRKRTPSCASAQTFLHQALLLTLFVPNTIHSMHSRTCMSWVAAVNPALAPWEISGSNRMEAFAPPVLSLAQKVPASCQARRTMIGMQGLALGMGRKRGKGGY